MRFLRQSRALINQERFDLMRVKHRQALQNKLKKRYHLSRATREESRERSVSKTGAKGEALEWLQSVSPEKVNVPVTNTTLPQKRPRHEENEFVKGARIGSADTVDENEPENEETCPR